ncbi:hypothetical protein ACO2RV_14595 [Ancylobacter sp. VNQ12]|uniref:hypothetical protein n=1 Tax=Ancylobacter sp. VNQ12 TaxID=3400920 RepID=UPI003C05172E
MTDGTLSFGNAEEFDGDEEAARARVLHLARTEGLEHAYKALVAIAGDGTSPAAARGAAARTILEMAGALNWRDRAAVETSKSPAEMDGMELEAAIQRARRRARGRKDTSSSGEGVFE